ncbi:MAG: hypothetical protein L0214_12420 [candidate division NC10 bacterium]|nr:hypothetical protein [candidate division NC10 bacterium]
MVDTRILLPLLLSILGLIATAEAQTPTRLFGPKTYARTAGAPNQFTERFCATTSSGSFTLIVENGKDGENRLSSAVLTLNGQAVLRPQDLNQQAARVERVVSLHEENRLEVELRGSPGGFLTVRLECVGCLEVRIESPTVGGLMNQPSVLVTGTIQTAAPEVGVTVNGVLAQVNGTRFAAQGVPLQIGTNTLTVTATDFCQAVTTDTITVQTTALPEPTVLLTVSPSSGLAPLATTLSIASLIPGPLARVEVDFEGDGVIDHAASTLADLPHTYATEQFYFPTVTLTDASGNRVTATTPVNVFPLPDLPAKWEGMKGALTRGDIEAALRFIVASARPQYKAAFTVLAPDLPAIDSILADLTFVRVRGRETIFEMLRTDAGVLKSFEIRFSVDADGIWRLRAF